MNREEPMRALLDISQYPDKIRSRYENYLKTSFYFKDPDLRLSFQSALRDEGSLLHGPYPEPSRNFNTGLNARDLAKEFFQSRSVDLLPALIDRPLYMHQEKAIRSTHLDNKNIVVASGTASGKTESFLYPIMLELFRQHLRGELKEPGVRALILYPMNALANDQRERLGSICKDLKEANSSFEPVFGQYIGQTPADTKDSRRNATGRAEDRLDGELVFREEMRMTPPHILLTNYSMLEYLLIRPDDSPLFDQGRSKKWQFIVLDEAHQYRGAKGIEMGMLVRRLKQRLREGGRQGSFRCIATSATISSCEGEDDIKAVAGFAQELFGEPFDNQQVIFGEMATTNSESAPKRYHAFLRALEGAFLIHHEGVDTVLLNRKQMVANGKSAKPIEIALCRECGQHYYVGKQQGNKLCEANRDPSHSDFGVEYFLPIKEGATHVLCRSCGEFSSTDLTCNCNAPIMVLKCDPNLEQPDQLKRCESCGYQRGSIGDPVQEIVHGSDGPNVVIATALHELLPEDRKKVLAFADSRQEAAFFAWYAEDSYNKLRNRNLLMQALKLGPIEPEGLSIDDLRNRLARQWDVAGIFKQSDTKESKDRSVVVSIMEEVLTIERRLSLQGVGLVTWFVALPDELPIPNVMKNPPWNLTDKECRQLFAKILDEFRIRNAVNLPEGPGSPTWEDVSQVPQSSFCQGPPGKRQNVSQWGGEASMIVKHYLPSLISDCDLSEQEKQTVSAKLMSEIWRTLRERDRRSYQNDEMLSPGTKNGTFRLNPSWLRVKLSEVGEIWECDTCASVTACYIRGICPRNRCPGKLTPINQKRISENHYRVLYELDELPPVLKAEEHTAQIESDEARHRQERFKGGNTHLLSSSTTFEIGVDLGDLDVVFLRNVPPEPFNYTQRVGRAGRRETPGLALTYCRRNPHDLYHYENPVDRVIAGKIYPPSLKIKNKKIILRHMVATVLSVFFKANCNRFKTVSDFIDDWSRPSALSDVREFCKDNESLATTLRCVVPESMYQKVGIDNNGWIGLITGETERFAVAEEEVCQDYRDLENAIEYLIDEKPPKWTSKVEQLERRKKTIEEERTLNFLSRKAVIPKYGFPVDVVELETQSIQGSRDGVSLQRDLSQAIAEYAPGGKVVANKLEWESCGVKVVQGKAFPVRYYRYDDARSFEQWNEGDPSIPPYIPKYLVPEFGFVTPRFKRPKEPHGRTGRLYTTRPFFKGFDQDSDPLPTNVHGVRLTKALPGTLVILCEGRNRSGFYICRTCGAHMNKRRSEHKTPWDSTCRGMLEPFSLGHELVTDVICMEIPQLANEGIAYSVAYAVLLGVTEILGIPETDLNVTITKVRGSGETAIVLYDNVPGGAGLVAQLEKESLFRLILQNAKVRVRGDCGCDSSCYGCLRSYRNQFAHPYLDRTKALEILSSLVS